MAVYGDTTFFGKKTNCTFFRLRPTAAVCTQRVPAGRSQRTVIAMCVRAVTRNAQRVSRLKSGKLTRNYYARIDSNVFEMSDVAGPLSVFLTSTCFEIRALTET